MSRITSIVYTPEGIERHPKDHYARVPIEATNLISNYGIEGDRKGGHPTRQLNIMNSTVLGTLGKDEGFKVNPGEMGEQILVDGIDLTALKPGDRLHLGESSIVEVIEHRNGCDRFEHIQEKSRNLAKGRLGIIAKVITGGAIRVGDPVQLGQPEQV